jgi:hypothetical protein
MGEYLEGQQLAPELLLAVDELLDFLGDEVARFDYLLVLIVELSVGVWVWGWGTCGVEMFVEAVLREVGVLGVEFHS